MPERRRATHTAIEFPAIFMMRADRVAKKLYITAVAIDGHKSTIVTSIEQFQSALHQPELQEGTTPETARKLYEGGHIDVERFELMLEEEMKGI